MGVGPRPVGQPRHRAVPVLPDLRVLHDVQVLVLLLPPVSRRPEHELIPVRAARRERVVELALGELPPLPRAAGDVGDGADLQRLAGVEGGAHTDVQDVLVGVLVPHRGADAVGALGLEHDAQPLAVGDPHGLELVVHEGQLRAVLGDGREHAGHPEQPDFFHRRLQLVEVPRDVVAVLQEVAPDAVVPDAAAVVQHERVVVVAFGSRLLGDLHRRLPRRDRVEDLNVAVLRLHTDVAELGLLADGGNRHFDLADGRRSHRVERLRCHPDGLPGADGEPEDAPRLTDLPVEKDDVVAGPRRPPAVLDQPLAIQWRLLHVHHIDVGPQVLDLALPALPLERRHRHLLPRRRHGRAQIKVPCI